MLLKVQSSYTTRHVKLSAYNSCCHYILSTAVDTLIVVLVKCWLSRIKIGIYIYLSIYYLFFTLFHYAVLFLLDDTLSLVRV